jgi:hypothetical protein
MLSHNILFRLADQFAGLEPDDIVDRMKQHNDAGSESYRCWEASRLARDLAEARREFALGRAAQVRLAIDFGAPRGWRWTQFVFGLRTLAEGKRHAIGQLFRSRDKYPIANDFQAQFNHPYYYLRDSKAAAIAAHLNNPPFYEETRSECETVACRFGLTFEVPDFPSWHYPGSTVLVLYTARGARNAKSNTLPRRH